MRLTLILTLALAASLSLLAACSSARQSAGMTVATPKPAVRSLDYSAAGPPTIVYKTKADYSQFVPVSLSPDKSRIVSWPHPRDVMKDGKPLRPTALTGSYWLDNRGIGPNVAFLKLTYEGYSKLNGNPTAEELYPLILEKNPLVEMCNCGNRYQFQDKDEVAVLDQMIATGQLASCQKIK